MGDKEEETQVLRRVVREARSMSCVLCWYRKRESVLKVTNDTFYAPIIQDVTASDCCFNVAISTGNEDNL